MCQLVSRRPLGETNAPAPPGNLTVERRRWSRNAGVTVNWYLSFTASVGNWLNSDNPSTAHTAVADRRKRDADLIKVPCYAILLLGPVKIRTPGPCVSCRTDTCSTGRFPARRPAVAPERQKAWA